MALSGMTHAYLRCGRVSFAGWPNYEWGFGVSRKTKKYVRGSI